VYVKDVARTWVEAIDNKKSFNRVINIGYGKRTHILPLAQKVIKACGKDPKTYPFKFMPDRPGNQKVVESDTTLAKKLLDFKCNFTLQEGLNETLQWAMTYGKKN
jgi:nucleoside-diphosphate-sugar epimerase